MKPREFGRDANAVDRGREAAKEELLLRTRKDFVQARFDRPFTGRIARTVDVGGILKERENAALANFRESMQVEGFAVRRRKVDLEVAGMDDGTHRGLNGKRNAIDERVRDPDR